MSYEAMDWAMEQTHISSTARHVLLVMAKTMRNVDRDGVVNDDGVQYCWPSVSWLMEKTGYGRSTVFRALRELVTARVIGRINWKRPNGSDTSNVYMALIRAVRKAESGVPNLDFEVPDLDPPGPASGPPESLREPKENERTSGYSLRSYPGAASIDAIDDEETDVTTEQTVITGQIVKLDDVKGAVVVDRRTRVAEKAQALLEPSKPLTVNQRATLMAQVFYEATDGMTNVVAVVGICKKAINADRWDDRTILEALWRVSQAGRPLTAEVLRVELQRMTGQVQQVATGTQRAAYGVAMAMKLAAEKGKVLTEENWWDD